MRGFVIVKTPFRVSLFGGGTDFPEWFEENGGYVVSTTINKYCYVILRYLPPFFNYKYRFRYSIREEVNNIEEINHPVIRNCLKFHNIKEGIEIVHCSDIPAQSGVGSSSAFTAGLLEGLFRLVNENYVFKDSELFPHLTQLAFSAIEIERKYLEENTGWQDQIATVFGGLNEIIFKSPTFEIKTIKRNDLEENLMLFFTGFVRNSSHIQEKLIKNMPKKKKELSDIYQIAIEAGKILKQHGNIIEIGRLLNESWQIKSKLSNAITTDSINDLYQKAMKAGAIGGKILGAGGGGFLLFFVEHEKQECVKNALDSLLHVPFKFENKGCHIL